MSEEGQRQFFFLRSHLFFLCFLPLQVALSLKCPSGTHLYKFLNGHPDVCVECQHGYFMPNTDHQETQCRTCEEIKDLKFEILLSPCNKTHDAVIHCVDGYYRDLARNPRENGTCQRCTKCSDHRRLIGQACSTYRNTVCCMDENYDVFPNHDGVPLCRERAWLCRRGQYFDTTGFQCLQCPNNTFMPMDFHVRPECFKCRDYAEFESYRPVHTVIAQSCNSTHDTTLRCQDGFFVKYTMGYRHDAIGCSPCTNCNTTDAQYEGRKCDSIKDTVCCPEPEMTVVDTSDGPLCMDPSSSCGKGRCKQHNTIKRSVSCVPCEDNKESEHVTEDMLDGQDNVSQRQLVSDDHPGPTGNFPYKGCVDYDESGFKVACIVLAVLFSVLLSVNIAFLILYRYFNWKLYLAVSKTSVAPKDKGHAGNVQYKRSSRQCTI